MDATLLLIGGLCLLVIALALGWWWSARRWSRASRRRVRHAQVGERDAERLLEDAGFVVLDRQVRGFGQVEVDGHPRTFEVRADLVVELVADHPVLPRGAVLVAEVKTGDRAPDPGHPATRRQLLEYQRVFQPDGLLLVDVDGGLVLEIDFPETTQPGRAATM